MVNRKGMLRQQQRDCVGQQLFFFAIVRAEKQNVGKTKESAAQKLAKAEVEVEEEGEEEEDEEEEDEKAEADVVSIDQLTRPFLDRSSSLVSDFFYTALGSSYLNIPTTLDHLSP